MNRTIHTDDGYTISYGGGRLADVIIDGIAVECVQVRSLNWSSGDFGPEPTDEEIIEKVREFINPEDMPNYRDLARAYR